MKKQSKRRKYRLKHKNYTQNTVVLPLSGAYKVHQARKIGSGCKSLTCHRKILKAYLSCESLFIKSHFSD